MNRTITSNIAGYVFHIDEDAYTKLDNYLKTVRGYFSESEGRDEIIADIEARLAELLQETLTDSKHVIVMEDVNGAIRIMGQPEVFANEEEDEKPHATASENTGQKRLFRDPDDRVLGGVCAGASHYLGINDPIWFRLALLAAVFFAGTGILLYLILWIIIPEARSTSEKLQMRGEDVNISNIEKRVNEELETVKNKWNDLHGNSNIGRKVGTGVQRVLSLVASIAVNLIKFLLKLLGFLMLMFGAITFFSVLSIPFGMPFMMSLSNNGAVSSVDVHQLLSNLVGGAGMLNWINITIVLLCGIPLAIMAVLGLRLLIGRLKYVKGALLSFMGLWVLGVVMSFAIATIIASDFSSEGSDTETVELPLSTDPDQVIHLQLNHELGEDEPDMDATIFNLNLVTSGNSTKLYGKPEFDINMARTGGPKLVVKRLARAKLKQDAVQRASKIDYGFQVVDTALFLNGHFSIPDEELWRSQEVQLELLLPVGYTVFLSEELVRIIYDIDNTTNTYDGDMVGRRWIMTPEGLACVDCRGIVSTTDQTEEDELENLEKKLEERKRKLKREQEILDSLRQTQTDEENEQAYDPEQEDSILLKRVVRASYQVMPNVYRHITLTFPNTL